MSWTFTNDRELPRGVDPERFAEFCELNGNDACTYRCGTRTRRGRSTG